MRKYGNNSGYGGGAPTRTYGKTAAGWGNKSASMNLWAEVEAEEEARRQREKEKERLENEERLRRKREKKERKRREEEEREKRRLEGVVEGVGRLGIDGRKERNDDGEDRVLDRGVGVGERAFETPPTSPERDENGNGVSIHSSAATTSEIRSSPLRSSSTTPQPWKSITNSSSIIQISPRLEASQKREPSSIETYAPTPGPVTESSRIFTGEHLHIGKDEYIEEFDDSSEEEERDNSEDEENYEVEGKKRSGPFSPRPTSPMLTPDRRGGLRRKSSRLTISPEQSRGVSPTSGVSRLRFSSGLNEGSLKDVGSVKSLAPAAATERYKDRLSTSSMLSVAITPAKAKLGVAIGEYEVFNDQDHEDEDQNDERGISNEAAELLKAQIAREQQLQKPEAEKHAQESCAIQDGKDKLGEQTTTTVITTTTEVEEDEDDWSEWGRICVTQDELDNLVSLCIIPEILDFTTHITNVLKSFTISKLGEASYSEVFLQTPQNTSSQSSPQPRTVLKIIPFGYPTQCPIKQIHDELLITASMSPISGYIGFRSAHVVRGPFPTHLLDLWDHWDQYVKAGGSENDRPDFYGDEQYFAIIGLEDGGRDLENWSFKGEREGEGGWKEAREVFWRVAGALARGEKEREFEHRDLHFGNIVIKRVVDVGSSPEELLSGLNLEDVVSGSVSSAKAKSSSKKQQQKRIPAGIKTRLHVSLIDYTLSRARCPPNNLLSFTPLDDEALFEGKGDYQFDIYRFMKSHLLTHHHQSNPPAMNPLTGLADLDWSIYTPATNLYWLHYLLYILLNKKKELKKPPAAALGGTSSRSRARLGAVEDGGEDVRAYKDLEALWRFLECRPKGGGRRGATAAAAAAAAAADGESTSEWVGFLGGASGFVEWALREGKVRAEEL